MKSQKIFRFFDQAVNWSVFLYGIYKIFETILTFILYNKLSVYDFSFYANVHSIIFIVLLWIDFGFKKSIIRFLPHYTHNEKILIPFIRRIIFFKIITLFFSLPFCLYFINRHTTTFTDNHFHFELLAISIFITEGIISLIQLMYQAHFWHKKFALIHSGIFAFQMILNCIVALRNTNSHSILMLLFYTKILSGIITIIITGILLLKQYKTVYKHTEIPKPNNCYLYKSFIHHSFIMWANNNLKSLTERNILLPFLTSALGPTQANMFKVANDSALLFYRIIVKTIGSIDTTFLTHAKLYNVSMHKVFIHLHKKIATFVGIFSIFFLIMLITKIYTNSETIIIQLFAIITIGYLIEILLSPYERILEVEQSYTFLFTAYIPYITLILLLFFTKIIISKGLLFTIFTIHSIRLISAFIMKLSVQHFYFKKNIIPNIQLPKKSAF